MFGLSYDGVNYIGPGRNQVESISYIGVVALVLAVGAVALPRVRRAPPGAMAGLAVTTVFMGMATFGGGPVLEFLQRFPVYDTNYIGRTRSILGFTVAALAALGLQALLERGIAERARQLRWLDVVRLVGVGVAGWFAVWVYGHGPGLRPAPSGQGRSATPCATSPGCSGCCRSCSCSCCSSAGARAGPAGRRAHRAGHGAGPDPRRAAPAQREPRHALPRDRQPRLPAGSTRAPTGSSPRVHAVRQRHDARGHPLDDRARLPRPEGRYMLNVASPGAFASSPTLGQLSGEPVSVGLADLRPHGRPLVRRHAHHDPFGPRGP